MRNLVRKLPWLAVLAAGLGVGLVAPAANAAPVTPHVITFNTIVSFHSGKCVDVDGASQQAGTQVQQFTCNGTVAQLWTRLFTDSGYFELQVAASGQCMEVKDASQADSARVVQNPCNGNFNQQWTAADSGVPGFSYLLVRHSGKCLVMRSEALADRTPLLQAPCPAIGTDDLHSFAWQIR